MIKGISQRVKIYIIVYTLKRRQRAKIKTILALCQQTESAPLGTLSVYDNSSCFFNSVFTSFSWF
ncbi:hypothetical protein C6Y01_12250 [Bacillus sp. NMCC46]|nr:hypothetical protein C6Y01_12250 [Bacillus sp. NMCC46]